MNRDLWLRAVLQGLFLTNNVAFMARVSTGKKRK